MKKEAQMNADSDKKAKEEIDKLNSADTMIFQTEKQLKEYGDKIPADKKGSIENALNQLKEAHKSKDLSLIDSAMSALNTAWQAASEDMYKATQQQGGPQQQEPQSDPNAGKGKTDGEVTDVDFEEVK